MSAAWLLFVADYGAKYGILEVRTTGTFAVQPAGN
jgi:hypothetical protein